MDWMHYYLIVGAALGSALCVYAVVVNRSGWFESLACIPAGMLVWPVMLLEAGRIWCGRLQRKK